MPSPSRELRPRGGRVTESIMQDALLLVGEPPANSIGYTQRDRERVYDWCMRTHLAASDNKIAVPKKPEVLG